MECAAQMGSKRHRSRKAQHRRKKKGHHCDKKRLGHTVRGEVGPRQPESGACGGWRGSGGPSSHTDGSSTAFGRPAAPSSWPRSCGSEPSPAQPLFDGQRKGPKKEMNHETHASTIKCQFGTKCKCAVSVMIRGLLKRPGWTRFPKPSEA